MINYKEISKSSAKLTSTIKKEIAVIEELLSVQNGLKDSIEVYTNEISKAFANNEVFKNMLLASTEAASLQLSINIKDLENLIDKYNGKSAQKRLLNRIKTMQKKYGDGNL